MLRSSRMTIDGMSERERRKLEQASAIFEKHETEKLRKMAKRISKKSDSERSRHDTAFIKRYPDVFSEAVRRRERKLLERQRMEEVFDSAQDLQTKCSILADAIRTARHVIVYTGAGISTAANIPDYRGPNGLWTRKQRGEACVDPSQPFDLTKAEPTFTHMALVRLHQQGLMKYVVSQNCDGLHVRSGLDRSSLSELHGNMYLEICDNCEPEKEYFRSFDITQKTKWRRHRTGRTCHDCGNDLQDTIVLFGEKSRTVAPMQWEAAAAHVQMADVIVCLGTSLKVLKDYPSLWKDDCRLFIVNLQWTPKDDECEVKIHGRCDEVMHLVMEKLSLCPGNYQNSEDPLRSLAVSLRDDEEIPSSSSSEDRLSGCGWFSQGLHALSSKKEKEPKSKSKRKKR